MAGLGVDLDVLRRVVGVDVDVDTDGRVEWTVGLGLARRGVGGWLRMHLTVMC